MLEESMGLFFIQNLTQNQHVKTFRLC